MDRPELVCITYIATTPERLWEALTQGDFTRQYWYDRRIESDWKVGSPVRFFDGGSDEVTDCGEVLACDPPRCLSYTFKNEFDPQKRNFAPSQVTFTLEPFEGQVKLTLVHDRLHDHAEFEHFREGWAPIFASLKTLLELGQPLPRLRKLEE